MLKVNPIKTMALPLVLAAGMTCMAQNRPQNVSRQVVTENYSKANINQQDSLVSRKNVILEANKIFEDLDYYCNNPKYGKNGPAYIWGTNSAMYYDKDKIVDAVNCIDKDNVVAVVNKIHSNHPRMNNPYKAQISDITAMTGCIGYNEKINQHLRTVIMELADKMGMTQEVRAILTSNDTDKLDEAYNFIMGQ